MYRLYGLTLVQKLWVLHGVNVERVEHEIIINRASDGPPAGSRVEF